ncbi:MAG: serine hydrolase [Phenylobacterium sp.]
MARLTITRRAALASALLVSPATASAGPPADVARKLRAHGEQLARDDDFSGVVLLARDGRPIFRQAYGAANRADGVANRPDTKFNLASMCKMFTALGVLRLAAAGRLKLEDRLIVHLPDYPNRAVAEQVTIAQLLSHTSGLGNYWAALAKSPADAAASVPQTLALFVNDPLEGTPGVFAYSNDGYVVLGALIEKLTGRDYYEHVRETIFRPLGMNDTDFYRVDEVVPNLAIGYTRDLERPGKWRNNLLVTGVRGGPAGGGYSTAGDLLAFANALAANRLLSPEMTREWTRGRFDYAHGRYGYGCSEEVVSGHRIIGHSGGHFGIACELMIFEDLGYTLIILTNGEVDPFWDLNNAGKQMLAGDSDAIRDYRFTRHLADIIARDGVAAGQAAYDARPAGLKARESVIDVLGLKALHKGRPDAALALLRFNLLAFPDSSGAVWSYAEASRIAGRRDAALAAYRDYLKREPGDADAAKRIAALS